MSNVFHIPRFVALCGNPKSGKSLVQEILLNNYGVQPIDDGGPLREFAVNNLGLTWDQVRTQEGKLEMVEILGKSWQVRKILGELGNVLEAMFGKHIMGYMAVARCSGTIGSFSFGSVRRDQGKYYKAAGDAVVIGIRNPLALPTGNEFDTFDESTVDVWIENDALAKGMTPFEGRKDLEKKIHQIVIDLTWAKAAAA